MPLLLTVLAELLLCASHALAELRVERVESSHAVSHAWADRSDARPLREDCEVISFTDLCERQLSSGECFKLQPSTSPASCQLWGPAFPAPAQLQGDAAAQGVVTTCGTRRKLHISGQIEMISLRLEAETMIFEDAQVEAWHETPDLSIDQGGAFFSGGPFNLTRSNLTVKSTGAVKGGALAAAGDLTLVSSSLRVLNAAAAESGGGFYGEGTLRLRELSKVLVENVSAQKGDGAGFFVMGDADISDSGLIDIKNARSAQHSGGFFAKQRLQLTNHSTLSIQRARAGMSGGSFSALGEVLIADMSNVSITDSVAGQNGGGFATQKRLQVTNKSTLTLENVKAGRHAGGFNSLGEVEVTGSSTVKIANSHAVSGDGGGFIAEKRLEASNCSTLIILNATAGGYGGGFWAGGPVAMINSTVAIQHATAAEFGGGFFAEGEAVIAAMSNASISDAVAAGRGGGFHVEKGLRVASNSILNLQNTQAGTQGGGFSASGELDIGGSSTVEISNSHAISEGGGGFHAIHELRVTSGSTLIILNATAGGAGGGFNVKRLEVSSNSMLNLQNVTAGYGGGFNAGGELEISGNSTVKISNSHSLSGSGGGFAISKDAKASAGSILIILNATAARHGGGFWARGKVAISRSTLRIDHTRAGHSGGGFYADGGKVAMSYATVSIQHTRAAKLGGSFVALGEVLIADMSNVSITDSVAAADAGGFHAEKRLEVTNKSTLTLESVKAGRHAGGFLSFGEVEVTGSSTVKIANSHAVSGDGGGFIAEKRLEASNCSTLIILNATAGGKGGGFWAGGPVAMINSTVAIQHATAADIGGGFFAKGEAVIAAMSNASISDAVAAGHGGGFHVEKGLRVASNSILNLHKTQAGTHGGGFSASGELDIGGSSTVEISNSHAISEGGGGFALFEDMKICADSTLIILNATAGESGGGFHAKGKVSMSNSPVGIQHARAARFGGGFVAYDEVVIAEMSHVSITDAVAARHGGGFHVEKSGLQIASKSTLSLTNLKAGENGGGFLSQGEVEIGESSTVKISNSHTNSGDGAGFAAEKELKICNGSSLIILNATAGGQLGGGFTAGAKVAISSSAVVIRHAAARAYGGGFYAKDSIALADASTVAMSDTYAGVAGGGFEVGTVLTIHNSSMSMANAAAEGTGTAGRVDGMVLLSSQSSLDIHHAEGDANSAVLVASCLQLHPDSNLVLIDINGGHGLDLQNAGCSPLCANTTFQVADGAALNATGRLSSGLLSVEACPHEEVRLSGIHLRSWNSSLLTTRPSYVVVGNVNIHYQPPVDNLQILDAEDGFDVNSLAVSCPECTQGVTFKTRQHGSLRALSPKNLQRSNTATVLKGLTQRCECTNYQITRERFRDVEEVALEEMFQTCRFCHRHSYFQDGVCRTCEIYRPWSDGKRDVCHWLPHERQERVIIFTGAAVFVILTFIMFEILQAPLVVLDARSDLEDPSEVAAKRIFIISAKGPITSLPKSMSRLVHQRVHYRARGTGLQWLDFDPQKPKAINVCNVAQRKLLLQDALVPFDCASCRGSLHATETCFLLTLLMVTAFLLAMLPSIIKVAVMSGNRIEHTIVTAAFYIALPMAVVAAVLHWPVSWLIQRLYRRTPFSEALDDYQKQIHCKPHPGPDATPPRNQGLLVLTLRGLWSHFESFILEQNMHFVVANIVRPLTQSKGVSFVTLWGGKQVDYFVSHSWGTSFSHFVHSIGCHALSKEGPTSWMDAAYWICSFANNQWNIAAELADDPMDSAFARALRGGIKGVAMVLDHEVQPLTRVWCLFEFLLSSREQLELVFTTDVGVVGDDGCASFDIALEVGNKIECLEVAKCQASSDEDKRKIFEYIINTLGSLESMDGRIKQLMGEMLKKNLANVGSATDSLRKRLRRK